MTGPTHDAERMRDTLRPAGRLIRRTCVGALLVSLLIGCASQQTRMHSSVVDYLYPKSSEAVVQPSVPNLQIPLKVGIAFVPEHVRTTQGSSLWAGTTGGAPLAEARKTNLLEQVAANFRGRDFISEIEVIPSSYLTPGGGFANLDQIRNMYGVDVIALVSYDQIQFTDEGLLSLTYWTLVGAYAVSGEKNDTSTMLDTAVYDIASRKMLFRAPGTSQIKGQATPVNLSEALRNDSLKGFEQANARMIANLDAQLSAFKERIKQHPEQAKVVEREGYSGGGAFGLSGLIVLLALSLCAASARAMRHRRIAAATSARGSSD